MKTLDPNPVEEAPQAVARIERHEPVHANGESFDSLMRLAGQLVTTGFLPVAVKTPAQAVAIILTGKELGLGPMQSLRSICIIQGKPELAADLQLSIFHRDGGRSNWKTLTDSEAVLWLRHPNGDEHTETFTIADAKRAGLTGQNWQKYPKAMLRSRAITAALKSIGFEPLAGAYAPGEIGGPEIVEGVGEPATPNDDDGDLGPQTQSGAGGRQPGSGRSAGTTDKPAEQRSSREGARQADSTRVGTKPPTVATPELRLRFLNHVNAAPGQDGEQMMKSFCVGAEMLLPTESVIDLPLRYVPTNKREFDLWGAAMGDFESGEARKPFVNEEPSPVVGVQARTGTDHPAPANNAPGVSGHPSKRDPEWFMDVVCPVPRKGMKKDQYDKSPDTIGSMYDRRHDDDEESAYLRKRLFGLVQNFEGGWTKKDGTKVAPSPADIKFREALDAFADYVEAKGEKI